MKKAVLSLVLIVSSILTLSQVPEYFNYQVVVRDGNNPLTNQNVSFQMSILKGSTSGESQYSELHSANTGELGIVNLVIGNGTSKTGDITTIDWGADTYYLKVEIDKTGGANYVEMGTTQLLSVPYAMYAKSANSYPETDPNAVLLAGNQIITGIKTFTGTITVPTPINTTDAATKAYVDVLLAQIQTLQSMVGIIKDYDGNLYTSVRIGSQVWLGQNLKTTSYNDGSTIPLVTDNSAWTSLSAPGYCWFDNDEVTYKDTYGALYNWYTVNTGKLCPVGWHVPTDNEWTDLTTYIGGVSVAGGKLKESGIWHWDSPNTGATNVTSFTALPGGLRFPNAVFFYVGSIGFWWSATEYDATRSSYRGINYDSGSIGINNESKNYGFSIRCIKD